MVMSALVLGQMTGISLGEPIFRLTSNLMSSDSNFVGAVLDESNNRCRT